MKLDTTPIIDLSHQQENSGASDVFANDVTAGLSRSPKVLYSRYFYDSKGSKLFQKIMDLPEYYLTRSEFEVLNMHKTNMAAAFSGAGFFHLIDLGAGDALKTKVLLNELEQQQAAFDYVPIDISKDAMLQLSENLNHELPAVEVHAVVGEYFEALQWLHKNKSERKVVLFLGSNIGNFEAEDGKKFLKSIRHYLDPGDKLLMGVDLRKDPAIIIPAYDDAAGITAEFNLNLLERINRELGGDFNVHNFRHYATYEPQEGAMKSYLISKVEQQVTLQKTGQSFNFEAWEAIHTENSYKYTLQQVAQYAKECGFEQLDSYQDKNNYFADILFSVV